MVFSIEHGQIYALCDHGDRRPLTLKAAHDLLDQAKRVVMGKANAIEVKCFHGQVSRLEHRECIDLLASERAARKHRKKKVDE